MPLCYRCRREAETVGEIRAEPRALARPCSRCGRDGTREQVGPLHSEAIQTATRELLAQIEYELLGAWRAGYEYVHLFTDATVETDEPIFRLRNYVFPSHEAEPPDPLGLRYVWTYVLTDVTVEDVRAARESCQ